MNNIVPDNSESIVDLSMDDYKEFKPKLQGPVKILNQDLSIDHIIGLKILNTSPQTMLVYTLTGKIQVLTTFNNPAPLFQQDIYYNPDYVIMLKEVISMESEEKEESAETIPLIQINTLETGCFNVLYNQRYFRIDLPWLRHIHNQVCTRGLDKVNFSLDPSLCTELNLLYEFDDLHNSCIAIEAIFNTIFILREEKSTNRVNFNVFKMNHMKRHEIQKLVKQYIMKNKVREDFDHTKALKEFVSKDFKLPKFNATKLAKENKKLSEKEFLKLFAENAKKFAENVTTEIALFVTDISRRQNLVKELQEKQHEKVQEAKYLLNQMDDK